ncbi:hypothetical protein ALC62_01104 [Cyphomyrmex costatus]|uniref:Uncharacterized protein n=1 Tax=Cyphomyrmex costatus TaxID=456900 RepID=A0A195D4X2_9HYME|nr:hypothetical protein ALC62_01104 [Cyphomyrmex costatus]
MYRHELAKPGYVREVVDPNYFVNLNYNGNKEARSLRGAMQMSLTR